MLKEVLRILFLFNYKNSKYSFRAQLSDKYRRGIEGVLFCNKKNTKGEYYWELLDDNDDVIGISAKSYKEITYCKNIIKTIMEEGPYADIRINC